MLFANLRYFYQMLANINKMADYVPQKSTHCIVDESPVRITTSRTHASPKTRQLTVGVGGGTSPSTIYGFSYNTRVTASDDSIANFDYPYVLITTQRFGDWKRTLTNEWLSLEGGTYFSGDVFTPMKPPSLFVRGTNTNVGGTVEFVPNSSLYDTEEYDDYLIVIGIVPYTEDYSTATNIYHQARSRATQCYNYATGTKKGDNIANDTNNLITFSPWACMPTSGVQTPWNLLVNLYKLTLPGAGTIGVFNLDMKVSQADLPFVPCFRAPRNAPILSIIAGAGSAAAAVSTREIAYMFPNFESVQKWFYDFGIKAYESVDDMYQDRFPEDIDTDIGYPDDPTPEDPEAFPDNSSDPTDFASPALSNLDLYNIYLLNHGGYISLKQLLLTTDIWNSIKNWLTQPLNSIYSLKLFPFKLNVHDSVNVSKSNELILLTTTLSPVDCYKVLPTYRFTNFNLGSMQLSSYYGNYLDYQAEYYLYIPCCSPIRLEPSSILNQTIYLKGIIDLVSGDMTVDVIVNNNIIANTSGNISYEINISFDSIAQTQNNIILQKVATIGGNLVTANWGGLAAATAETAKELVMTRNHIESTGNISFNNAIYNFVTPYLKICLKVPSQPSNYKQLQGMNSSATIKISQVEGYVKGTPYGKWQISGATSTEVNMIKELIQSGIYI